MALDWFVEHWANSAVLYTHMFGNTSGLSFLSSRVCRIPFSTSRFLYIHQLEHSKSRQNEIAIYVLQCSVKC